MLTHPTVATSKQAHQLEKNPPVAIHLLTESASRRGGLSLEAPYYEMMRLPARRFGDNQSQYMVTWNGLAAATRMGN